MTNRAKLGWLVAGTLVLRSAAATLTPLLAGEAYYWLWGWHLAPGYFDHPPMVGWMSRLFVGWMTGSALIARTGPLVLGALTILAVYGFARELFGDARPAFRAAAWTRSLRSESCILPPRRARKSRGVFVAPWMCGRPSRRYASNPERASPVFCV